MTKHIHLVKLSVGSETVESLQEWQNTPRAQGTDGLPRHITRMWPKREADLLMGGSMYWVIKGFLQCRQRILRLDEVVGQDGIRRCAIVLDPKIIRTTNVRKRPFQGWRYLEPVKAPQDATGQDLDSALPPHLERDLKEAGLL